MEGVMRAQSKKMTQWKDDLFLAVKSAQQKLSKYYAGVSATTGMLHISAHIFDPFHKFWLFRKWDKGMHIDPVDETSYTTQYQDAFLKYVEKEYGAKHRSVPVIKPESVPSNNVFPTAPGSGSGQSSFDPYNLCSEYEEYIMPNNVAETTPGQSDQGAHLLTVHRLHMNSPPESANDWGQVNPNFND